MSLVMDDQKEVPGWPNGINDEKPSPQSGGAPINSGQTLLDILAPWAFNHLPLGIVPGPIRRIEDSATRHGRCNPAAPHEPL